MPVLLPRAEPFYFGPDSRSCFGWLHRPGADLAPPRLALVICNPFGYEAAMSHRSLRHFAEAAATLGVPTVRFDYDGTGDSAGDDHDPGRWAAWLDSVHQAVDWVRGATGVQRVCLLGVRLGASLAAIAASRRDDVAALVAIAPVVSGKAWLRELKTLEAMTGFPPPPPGFERAPGDHESLGFLLTAETQASITTLNLVGIDRPPAPEVLVIERDDLPGDERLATAWRTLNVRVQQSRVPGYAQMMLDPHEAVVPVEMVEMTSKWVQGIAASVPTASPPSSSPDPGRRVLVAPGVEETAVFLEGTRRLFGILSTPAGGRSPKQAVMLLNSGANPHVGPSRLYVRLARDWAARGCVVLRMDVAGIGDSLPQPGQPENVVYAPGAVAEVAEAAKYLAARFSGATLRAAGLCSGAYHAFRAAVAGVGFQGVAIVNPLVFHWKPGMSLAYPSYQVSEASARYKRSLFQVEKWKKVLSGGVDIGAFGHIVARRAALRANTLVHNLARSFGRPMGDDLGAELQSVAKRGVALRFVFSAGDPGEDLLEVGAGWTLPGLLHDGRVQVQRIVGPNHAFTPVWSQRALAKALDVALALDEAS